MKTFRLCDIKQILEGLPAIVCEATYSGDKHQEECYGPYWELGNLQIFADDDAGNELVPFFAVSIPIIKQLLNEIVTLEQRLEVADNYFRKIDGSRLDWFSTSCIAKEALAKLKTIEVK